MRIPFIRTLSDVTTRKEVDKMQDEKKPVVAENEKEANKKKRADYQLAEFFDDEMNWGKRELTFSRRPGRPW